MQAVEDQDAEAVVEAVLEAEGDLIHRLYRIEVLDGEGGVIAPDPDADLPIVSVTGLDLSAARVVLYDEAVRGAVEIAASTEDGAAAFELAESAVYDIVTAEAASGDEVSDDGDETPDGTDAVDAAAGVEPDMPAFEQSAVVSGVVITVKAEPGVFPAGAELSVASVPVYSRAYRDRRPLGRGHRRRPGP